MSIFGYARLNKQRPTPKNLGIRNQVKIIQRWTEEKGLTIRKIFRDTVSSSASLEFPNLKKLISLIEQGEVSVLVVARLDRLTRVIRLHKKLLDLFEEKNVRFVSIMEGLDSKSKSGKKFWTQLEFWLSGMLNLFRTAHDR